MKKYQDFTREELQQEKELLMKKYKEYQDLHLNLNMARGKPGADQLALSMPMLDVLNSSSDVIFTATAEFLEWKKEGKELPI